RSLRESATCGVAIRSVVCRPARSGCWPRPARFWSVSWRWPRAPTTPRRRPSSTRFWPPLPEGPDTSVAPETGTTGKVVAVVPAAGSGERLAAGIPKAFCLVDGRTLLQRAVAGLLESGVADHVVVAVPADRLDEATRLLGDPVHTGRLTVVAGGPDRTE